MGLDAESVRFLAHCRKNGAKFDDTLTLGRQHFFLSNKETESALTETGLEYDKESPAFHGDYPRYSDDFWSILGARQVETMDASNFEGATIIHDLNQAVRPEWHSRYDALCDVGTLEHVFNLPTALENCMNMVKPKGSLLILTTANNYFGHGFYQFSPELFFRVLSTRNGYAVREMIAVEYGPLRKWYSITDPEKLGARVTLINRYPVLIFVWAQRNSHSNIHLDIPQQSDYQAMWKTNHSEANATLAKPLPKPVSWGKRFLLEYFPGFCRLAECFYNANINTDYSFRNRKFFSPMNKRWL